MSPFGRWQHAKQLMGRRVLVRPLVGADWEDWREVRIRAAGWLLHWEPLVPAEAPDPTLDRRVFVARCSARDRERQLGSAYSFGFFVGGRFCGEMNLSGVQRGAFQNAHLGYWIDEAMAGKGLTPEAAAVVLRFAFEELGLHRVQVNIIPRNLASNRVAEKLGLRLEGTALRYLEINGQWEDHHNYAMTVDDWQERRRWFAEHYF